ncbi:hypothetical protein K458DRAFT_388586 [Lentithecium fluviatile CBS 122367]|uniref:Uncharacterized protein n=1 Tax=Lentithecium fluviatile CBS 122367 TaxID=1168545 RepID=A0A6G1J425_9PLEO|nr:hypothetical protein K458DRAFT_388586 [Lentithecium fluviatile CBS 122367]
MEHSKVTIRFRLPATLATAFTGKPSATKLAIELTAQYLSTHSILAPLSIKDAIFHPTAKLKAACDVLYLHHIRVLYDNVRGPIRLLPILLLQPSNISAFPTKSRASTTGADDYELSTYHRVEVIWEVYTGHGLLQKLLSQRILGRDQTGAVEQQILEENG